MELALIPVAAILLLLSGISSPAHAGGQSIVAVALMRDLLGSGQQAPTRILGRRVQTTSQAGVQRATGPQAGPGFDAAVAEVHLATHAAPTSRKLYRTRFGFAEGAYLALGPPPARL